LWIAEQATGSRGVRAFRQLPYWSIRNEARLASRVSARNRGLRATSDWISGIEAIEQDEP